MFPTSYEAAINCTHPNSNKTGSLYLPAGNFVNYPESPVRPGEWMTLEIIAKGRSVVVKINNKIMSLTMRTGRHIPKKDTSHFCTTRLSMVNITGQTHWIEFRKIEIKELNGVESAVGEPVRGPGVYKSLIIPHGEFAHPDEVVSSRTDIMAVSRVCVNLSFREHHSRRRRLLLYSC